MIQLSRPALSAKASQALQQYQSSVDTQVGFPAQVIFAKADFPKKNIIGNATFDEVKQKLVQMSSGAERCHYCEDSKADEVEHLLPKDVYPGHCYSWNNYYYACGNCNGPKNNKCAVIDLATNEIIDLTPPVNNRKMPVVAIPKPPAQGISAFIDLATENPLDYFFLDLKAGSFDFSEFPDPGTTGYLKAKYTLEVLRLNKRPFLSTARRNAYKNFKARLSEYIADRANNIPVALLNEMIAGIRQEAHQTVWQEMKRQKDFIPELQHLFGKAPEALSW